MTSQNPTLKKLLITQLRALLVVALILSMGVGTIIIQVFGWATMLPTQFVKTGSVSQAVENTFDGKHACAMCEIASAKREVEQEQPADLPNSFPEKTKLPLIAHSFSPISVPTRPSLFGYDAPQSINTHYSVTLSTDTPPPQV